MIKPDAFKAGISGKILNDIIEAGFKIVALKMVKLSTYDGVNVLTNFE